MPPATKKKKAVSKSKPKRALAKVPNTPAGECIHWLNEDPDKLLNLLPATMDKERYRRIVVSEILGNEKIQNCTGESIWGAISLAAKMCLEPGAPGNGWLIPFKEKDRQTKQWASICKFMPGYQGLCSFLIGKGAALSIRGEVVRDNDLKFVMSNTGIIHEWSPHMSRSRRGKLIAVYTNILYPNGVRETVAAMSEDQVHDVRAKSKSYQRKQGPWVGTETDIEEMWKKTSVIRACKGMDFSSHDNAVIREVVEDDSLVYEADYEVHEVAPEDAAPQGSDAVAEKLEAAQQVQQTLDTDGEPDRSDEEPPPEGHFRCKDCRGVFPTSGPHATTGRSKICGGCSGMDGV